MQALSDINSIYNELLTVCYYINFVFILVELVLKNEDIQESMKNVRVMFGMVVIAWIHLYLR
jgi:hypothetical protein